METLVRTPRDVFFNPQRLLVPLFQRPYVWNKERQWEPLWSDIQRVADRILEQGKATPHFLGAVVLQQQPSAIGTLGVRTIIDGQQRLTTLQILLSAVHSQVKQLGLDGLAQQVLDLVANQPHFRNSEDDTFKVWPTNRDRAAFNAVMSASIPIDYSKLSGYESRLVEAHEYFSNAIQEWLLESSSSEKAHSLVSTVSQYLQIVVIDLFAEEDAQEIFETLNARGTPLSAADLIKNFVFQRLNVSSAEAERAYRNYWEIFETPFWEAEVSAGRIRYGRSSLFLTQWLVAQSRQDITAREVFSRFKVFVSESDEPVGELLPKLKRAADVYQAFTEGAMRSHGELTRLEAFVYRVSTLDSEVVKPLVLWLVNPESEPVPEKQLEKTLNVLESWLVRRAIVRASTKNYNRLLLELLNVLQNGDRALCGDETENFLAKQTSVNSYWPGDEEIKRELIEQPIYRRLSRARLRMILEALEDKRRGYTFTSGGRFSESSVPRNVTSIEHVMPQEWASAWDGTEFDEYGLSRNLLVHTLGNLTLLTQSLNSKVSNSSWEIKKAAFREHATLLLTSDITNDVSGSWGVDQIRVRSANLANDVVEIWPVPSHNKGLMEVQAQQTGSRVTIADLVHADLLAPGQKILARVQAHLGREGFISDDGAIFVDGVRCETPSGAAKQVTGSTAEDGWWFWQTDLEKAISLSDIRKQYLEMLAIDDAGEE